MTTIPIARAAVSTILLALCAGAAGAQDYSKVAVTTTKLSDAVYMLKGAGGNIGVSAGEDGILMIDSQVPPMHDKIVAALAAIRPGPVRLLLNTNWHFDHAQGNALFGDAGAVIVAHQNCRGQMAVGHFYPEVNIRVDPLPPGCFPTIEVGDSSTLHFNGDEIRVLHLAKAHSDADLVFHFVKAGVIHVGDIAFAMYPYIDLQSGGSVDGDIAAVDRILGWIPGETRVIAGHGRLMTVGDLRDYRRMMADVRDRVAAAIAAKKTVEEIVASRPTADLDARWGADGSAEQFVRQVYHSLTGTPWDKK